MLLYDFLGNVPYRTRYSLISPFQLNESSLFPDGSKLEFRCNSTSAGFYALGGSSVLKCANGEWSARIPFCKPTSYVDEEFSGETGKNEALVCLFIGCAER